MIMYPNRKKPNFGVFFSCSLSDGLSISFKNFATDGNLYSVSKFIIMNNPKKMISLVTIIIYQQGSLRKVFYS